ncbi:MAG: hypothetical protein ACXADF_18860, partial [Candidatus Thorarchaeota archaeon]
MTTRDHAILEAIKEGDLLRDVATDFSISAWREAWHRERGISLYKSSKKLSDYDVAYIIRWRLNGSSIEAIAADLSRSILGIISAWQNYATDEQKRTLNERVTKSIVWTDEKRERLQELMNEGYSYTYIADLLELPVSAIKRYLYYRHRGKTIQGIVAEQMDDSPAIPVESGVDDDIPVNGVDVGESNPSVMMLMDKNSKVLAEAVKELWTELDIERLLIETGL